MWGPLRNLLRQRSSPNSASETYRAYTTKYDLEIPAKSLSELFGDGGRLGEQAFHDAAKEYDRRVPALRIGADLAAIEAVGHLRSVIGEQTLKNTVVSLLIDHSGSMKGQRSVLALTLTLVLADMWSRLGATYEILGYTTRSWHGGMSRQAWKRASCPRRPGRLCDLLHIVYRAADDGLPGVPWLIRNLLRDDLLKENIDGEAIQWAVSRLRNRPKNRKILIVIADGAPVDDSTLMENGPDILVRHVREVISELQSARDIEIAAIGIDYDVSRFYALSTVISGFDDLAEKAVPFVEKLLIKGESAADTRALS